MIHIKPPNTSTLCWHRYTHVHLIFKKTSRFFGSISAIYSEFTAEEIGITEETLRHKGLSDGVSFATKKAIIQQGVLIRSARK